MDPMGIATRFLKQFLWFSIMTGGLVLNIFLKWPPLVQVSKFILKWAGMRTNTGSRFFFIIVHWTTVVALFWQSNKRIELCQLSQASIVFRPPVALATPPKSSPPSDGGRMAGGASDRVVGRFGKKRWTFNVGRLQVAVFFGLNSLEAKKHKLDPIQEEMMVLSVEILLDFGVLRTRNAGSCTIVGFPPQVYQGTPTHCCW